MAVWKQSVVVLFLALAGLAGWGMLDSGARNRLEGLGVPGSLLPAALFPAAGENASPLPGKGGPGPAAGPGGPGRGGPAPVVVAAVEPAVTDDRVLSIGTGEAARSLTVLPRSSGMVTAIGFTPGAAVAAGAPLITLDDEAERIALEKAEVALADARAKVERYERLSSSAAISPVERDAARSALAAAELEMRQARLDLDRRTVTAPFAGIAGLTDFGVGDMVSPATEIVTLDDRGHLTVTFRVPEAFAARVALGQVVTATTPARPGETFAGSVTALGSRVEADSRTLVVEARIANAGDMLRPGMSFLVSLAFPGRSYPSVPALALQWDREGAFVWRVNGGKVERVGVAIAERRADRVLVTGALAPGDPVVVEGVLRLRAGAEVAVQPPAPAG